MNDHNQKPEYDFDLELRLRVRRRKAVLPWVIVTSLILSAPNLVELLGEF